MSTSGTIAVGDDPDMVYHEDDPPPFSFLSRWPYYLSKFFAERAALDVIRIEVEAAQKEADGAGPELIILNPSLLLGPGDDRNSSTEDVRRFLDRQIPLVPAGGFSFCDARDVADAAVAALNKGRHGHRYLLGGLNLTFEDFFERLEEVSGVKGPLLSRPMPPALSRIGVGILEKLADAVGAKLPVTSEDADMSGCFWYVDSRKAERELEFAPRDPMVTLRDTVRDIQGL
jgi:dihydroflavonol-4-reductase